MKMSKKMLEMKRVEMFLGDGMREVVVVTSPVDQMIFNDERKFHLKVTKEGEVTLETIEGEEK